jgi:ABC-type dipeptide/oligopeptide/nickel transport system permease component
LRSYLVRRLLIMVPTFVGISFALWLVMTLAPGEPDRSGGSGPAGGAAEGMGDREEQDRNVLVYRRQFNLDRPRFWNAWTGLEEAEVEEAVRVVSRGAQADAGAWRAAKRRLDDWGHYAVPALVALIGRLEGEEQSTALRALRQGARRYRKPYPAGYRPTPEALARDREVERENAVVRSREMAWGEADGPEARAAVAARWRAWLEARKEQWAWDAGDRLRIAVTDTQFFQYWANLATLDFGVSHRTGEPVWPMIRSRLKYSLSIVLPAFLLAWVLAVFLGVTSAANHGRILDQGTAFGLFVLYSIPTMVAGTLLQKWLATGLGWFPAEGFDQGPDARALNTWEYVKDVAWHVTLPIACFAYGSLAFISRLARSGMLDVLRSDYVRTARAKGLPERTVIWRHAVRNGLMPIVTMLGTALPVLLGGSVVIEYIFNIDGFGLLMINSINARDYNVVMGISLIVAALTLVGLLLTDLFYAVLDPRISYA